LEIFSTMIPRQPNPFAMIDSRVYPIGLSPRPKQQCQHEVPNRSRAGFGRVCACAASLLAAASVHAATLAAPYTQDFQSFAANASLPDEIIGGTGTVTTNSWSTVVSGGNTYYQNNLVGTSAKGLDSLQFSNLGPALAANTGFKVSVQMLPPGTITAGTNVTQGVRFLAATTNTVNDAYAVDFNIGSTNPGRMRLIEWSGATPTIYPDLAQANQPLVPNFDILKAYQLDVVGMYDSLSRLLITATVTEVGAPANTATSTFTTGANISSPDASPRTGSYFGFYTSFSGAATEVTNFDNLSVTLVPEPASLTLLGLAAIGLCTRRSRMAGHSTR
jgi:hypothetical protein